MQTNALRKAALASCLWTSAIPLTGAAEPDSNPMTIIKGDTVKAITGPPDKFTGNVVITPKFGMQGTQRSFATAGDVMFLPHSRSHWHSHPAGQYLIITAGQGWVQQWGKTRQTVSAGLQPQSSCRLERWNRMLSLSSSLLEFDAMGRRTSCRK